MLTSPLDYCTSALAQVAGIEDPPSISPSSLCTIASSLYHSSSSVSGIFGAIFALPCATASWCLPEEKVKLSTNHERALTTFHTGRQAPSGQTDNLRVERSAFHASATIAIVVIVCRRKIEGDHKDVIRLTKEYTHHVYNLRSRCMGQAIGKSERIILGLSRLKVRIPPPIPNVLARRSRVRRRAVPAESILHLFVVSALTLPSKKRHSPRYPSEHPQR